MSRRLLAVAAAIVLFPAVASARTQAVLDCGVVRAPAGLADNLAAGFVAADRARLGPLQNQLGRIVGQCVAANRLTDREGEAYYDYLLARLPREALARQLARAGVAAAQIDAAMGFGPGQPNRPLVSSSEEAVLALKAKGIDEARVGAANWRKVLTYIDLTPRFYRYLAVLN